MVLWEARTHGRTDGWMAHGAARRRGAQTDTQNSEAAEMAFGASCVRFESAGMITAPPPIPQSEPSTPATKPVGTATWAGTAIEAASSPLASLAALRYIALGRALGRITLLRTAFENSVQRCVLQLKRLAASMSALKSLAASMSARSVRC